VTEKNAGFKQYFGLTFLIGLGFFTMGLMDPLYDAQVPTFLNDLLERKSLVGLIMTLDNVFALLLIPIVSHLSDITKTRIGRRMPYILVTLPLSAVFFGAIPFTATSLAFIVSALFLLNLAKQSARGPVVALMPDIVPGQFRSEANGVINTMGGIAAIVGTIALNPLMDLSIVLPLIGNTLHKLPFVITGVLVIVATIILVLFVREREHVASSEKREPLIKSLKIVAKARDRSALWILVALFLWFLGYQGLSPFVTLYTMDAFGLTRGIAGLSMGMVAVAYAAFAIPSGYVAHKIGRKRTIRISLIGAAVDTLLIFFHGPLTAGLGHNVSLYSFWACLFVFGIFWGSIITNSFPMLWQMATYTNVGVYTGLYYFFSQTAAIVAPPIAGAIIDASGYRPLFLMAAACLLAAFFVMGIVKGGEPDSAASSLDTTTEEGE
jgi:maltose/moltooligosaccharide transporter